MLLMDAEWGKWSNVRIAEKCGIHQSTVADIRNSLLETESDNYQKQPITYTDKHGNISTMNTSNIGKSKQIPEQTPKGDCPLFF